MSSHKKFGSWVAGGNSQKGRRKNDFYATPSECTFSLAAYMNIPVRVWEPACGSGAISAVLSNLGHEVTSTDLEDYNFGTSGINFLDRQTRLADCVITNPPFSLAEDFIRKCRSLEVPTFAMLLKTQYWHAAKRLRLFNEVRPSKILAMTWRPDFTGNGNPTMDCIWSIWEPGTESTHYLPIECFNAVKEPDVFG